MNNKRMTQIILIRHAESLPSSKIRETDWPLSSKGFQQTEWLAQKLKETTIHAIFSSPYRRAIATVKPLSVQTGKKIQIDQNLRERKLCERFGKDWHDLIRKAWADFGFSLPGCESGYDCQKRIVNCINNIVRQHDGQTLIVSSHGNAIGLFLNSIDTSFSFNDWKAMKNPDIFEINYKGRCSIWHKS